MNVIDFPFYADMMQALQTREAGLALCLVLSVIGCGLAINGHYHLPKLEKLIHAGALQGFLALLALGIALI